LLSNVKKYKSYFYKAIFETELTPFELSFILIELFKPMILIQLQNPG